MEDAEAPAGIDVTRPHPARIYDYGLGGDNHFAVDRAVAERVLEIIPTARTMPLENRKFMRRAVRYLAGEAGIRQFLDIGSGLPATGNVHEVARGVDPRCRVVYVDNDPLVLVHARALLASADDGRTGFIQGDLRDPASILCDSVAREILDFSQPVALVMCAVLHFLADSDHPAEIVGTLLGALPAGSYLVASHATFEHTPPEQTEQSLRAYRASGITFEPRHHDDFAGAAFRGLDMVPPGVVLVSEWRPEEDPRPSAAEVSTYGGVGRKPGSSSLV